MSYIIFSNLPRVHIYQSVLGTQWYILQCRGFESHLGMLFFFPELSRVYVHVVVDFACFALALLTHMLLDHRNGVRANDYARATTVYMNLRVLVHKHAGA